MKVLVTFEPDFVGDASDAVWIIDSPRNRAWYRSQVDRIDPNSAVFDADSDPPGILWHVFEHHPAWTEIRVRGTELTRGLADGVESEAVVRDRGVGDFTLIRR